MLRTLSQLKLLLAFQVDQVQKGTPMFFCRQALSAHMVPWTQMYTRESISPFKKITVLNDGSIKEMTISVSVENRTLSKQLLQSTCNQQHSNISPATYRLTNCSNTAQQRNFS